MRIRYLLFAVAFTMWLAMVQVGSGRSGAVDQLKESAVIDGVVTGTNSDPGKYTVFLEGTDEKTKAVTKLPPIDTDEEGHFRMRVEPAIYTAHLKPLPEETDRQIQYAPFRVEAGEIKRIEVDATSELVYCTAGGERVIPARRLDGTKITKGLHVLRYQSFSLSGSKKGLPMVIEYCRKDGSGQTYKYVSPVVSYDGFRLISDHATFDRRSLTLHSWDNVGVVQHGTRDVRKKVSADFSHNHVVLNLTGGVIPSVWGKGTIKSGKGKAIFDFKINGSGIANFLYVDGPKGWTVTSREHDCLIVIEASKESFKFAGSAQVIDSTGHRSIVNFTVTLQDSSGHRNGDSFEISIPNFGYSASGTVDSDAIKVSGLNKLEYPLAGLFRKR